MTLSIEETVERLEKLQMFPSFPISESECDLIIICEAAIHHIRDLESRLNAKQAELDAVMFEYCPDEMTPEQVENWAKNQRKSEVTL